MKPSAPPLISRSVRTRHTHNNPHSNFSRTPPCYGTAHSCRWTKAFDSAKNARQRLGWKCSTVVRSFVRGCIGWRCEIRQFAIFFISFSTDSKLVNEWMSLGNSIPTYNPHYLLSFVWSSPTKTWKLGQVGQDSRCIGISENLLRISISFNGTIHKQHCKTLHASSCRVQKLFQWNRSWNWSSFRL